MAALFIIPILGSQLLRHVPYVRYPGVLCHHHCNAHCRSFSLHRNNLLAALKQLAAEGTSNQAKHATKALCAAFANSPSSLIEAAQVESSTKPACCNNTKPVVIENVNAELAGAVGDCLLLE